jgi:hypothetical protein
MCHAYGAQFFCKTNPGFTVWARRVLVLLSAFLVLGKVSAISLSAQEEGRQMTMAEAVEHALEQSQLTAAGGTPFHLKAHIAAAGRPSGEYSADVEEYWAGPEKWRRTVESAGFSQTLVVNGGKLSEKLTGDYYPFWLHDLVTAIFDPLPMAEQLKRMRTNVEIPQDSTRSHSCVNMQSRVGVAPAQNTVEYAFCFGGKLGLLNAAITSGYRAQFADYQPFKGKMAARTISADFAPGLTITAKITELTELGDADEGLFAVETPTPAAEQLKSSQVGEDSARVLAQSTPPIVWPTVREGSTSGVLSLYISTDRSGRVREAWPAGSDNPQMTEAAREQVLRWQYKPYMNAGASQMEAVLTFAFNTRIENPVPVLKDAPARKLATRIVPPVLARGKAPRGTRFTLRVSVDETGKVQSVLNPDNIAPALWSAGSAALRKWRFRPYMNHGKPDRFYADITLQAP